MKPTLEPIPENQILNGKQKKTPRIKNTQYTKFDYIMMNKPSKFNDHNMDMKQSIALSDISLHSILNSEDVKSSFELDSDILQYLTKLYLNKQNIFNIMNNVFDDFVYTSTKQTCKQHDMKQSTCNTNTIKSKKIINCIKHCFIEINEYIESDKNYVNSYDISSNKVDRILTNQLNKPKQRPIDSMLEIKKKKIEPRINPYEILYRT